MGQLYSLIEDHMDQQNGYRISQRQVAHRLGVSPTTLANWRDPKDLIEKRHLVAIAELTRVPYHRVLDAILADIGYLNEHEHTAVEVQETAARMVQEARETVRNEPVDTDVENGPDAVTLRSAKRGRPGA